MKRERIWKGPMAESMQKHLSLRRALGRVSENNECTLYLFNEFLSHHYPKLKTPNRIAILDYLNSRKKLSPSGRRNAVITIRQFCKFLVSRGVNSYVPDKTLVPKLSYKPRYCAIEVEHILGIMSEARSWPYHHVIVRETYATMLGLLWCTAMRRKEVVGLDHSDVDLENGTILIRMSKFRKSRMVPLKKSVVAELKKYVAFKVEHNLTTKPSDPFFVTKKGTRMVGHSLQTMFQRAARRAGLKGDNGRSPCLHDIRHNFATRTIVSDPFRLFESC